MSRIFCRGHLMRKLCLPTVCYVMINMIGFSYSPVKLNFDFMRIVLSTSPQIVTVML